MFFDWSTDKSLVQRRSTSCTAHYCKKTITLSTQYSHWTSYWFRDVLLHVLHTTARRQSRSVLGTHIEQVIGSQTFYFTYCTLLQEDNHAQYSVLTLNKSLVHRRSTSRTAHYCKRTITLSTQYSHWTSQAEGCSSEQTSVYKYTHRHMHMHMHD